MLPKCFPCVLKSLLQDAGIPLPTPTPPHTLRNFSPELPAVAGRGGTKFKSTHVNAGWASRLTDPLARHGGAETWT